MSLPCETCKKLPSEANHPPGMIFVGWGRGSETCPTCKGTAIDPTGSDEHRIAQEAGDSAEIEQLRADVERLTAERDEQKADAEACYVEVRALRGKLAVSEQARLAHAREVERLRDENKAQRSDLDLYRDNERDQGVELAALRDLKAEIVKLFPLKKEEHPIDALRRGVGDLCAQIDAWDADLALYRKEPGT